MSVDRGSFLISISAYGLNLKRTFFPCCNRNELKSCFAFSISWVLSEVFSLSYRSNRTSTTKSPSSSLIQKSFTYLLIKKYKKRPQSYTGYNYLTALRFWFASCELAVISYSIPAVKTAFIFGNAILVFGFYRYSRASTGTSEINPTGRSVLLQSNKVHWLQIVCNFTGFPNHCFCRLNNFKKSL